MSGDARARLPHTTSRTRAQVVHDFNNWAVALRRHFGSDLEIGCVLDTQLALEVLRGDVHTDLDSVLKAFAGGPHSICDGPHRCRGFAPTNQTSIRNWFLLFYFPFLSSFCSLVVVCRRSSGHTYSMFLKQKYVIRGAIVNRTKYCS